MLTMTGVPPGPLPQRLALGVLFLCCLLHTADQAPARPHIVVIMADDLGWNDLGLRDSEMHTPHLDQMASEGVNMSSSYMMQVCTPSRAAFLTGVYPFRMGLQHFVITGPMNASLPLQYDLLPQRLQRLGYQTHMVGKWHLGFCNPAMTPTHRGFHSFYGLYNGQADHYNHKTGDSGYDIHNDRGSSFVVDHSANGTYSSHLFTDKAIELLQNHDQSQPLFLFLSYQAVHYPLQVPDRYVNEHCANVTTGEYRKLKCAMTAAMDEGIGNVTAALDTLGFSDNLITLFLSDNGGPIKQGEHTFGDPL